MGQPPPIKTVTVDANGVRFSALGAGEGPLVLLAHGFPDTAHTWDRAIGALANAGFRAVAPFMRGYFPTEIPPDGRYDTETLGSDLLAIATALGERSFAIVGHDWGASAAYSAAARAPDHVRLLVPFAIPHTASVRPTPSLLWKVRHFAAFQLPGAADRLRANDCAKVDELWRRWSPAWKRIPPEETAHVKAAFRQPGVAEAAIAYYRALRIKTSASMKQPIAVPTVAFAGEHDIIEPRLFERARHFFAKSYEVVQVPGGHFMHREHPDIVISELVRVICEHHR